MFSSPARPFTFLTLIALLFGGLPASPRSSPNAWQTKVEPALLSAAADSPTQFLVFLEQQADLTPAKALASKEAKGAFVFHRLAETAHNAQAALLAALDARQVKYQAFWIANVVLVQGDASLLEEIAQRKDVAHLYANPQVRLSEPAPESDTLLPQTLATTAPAGWSISYVGAPVVWQAGYTGQGVVVGGQDTGYEWDHPALKNAYRGWDGDSVDHNYNWHDAIHNSDQTACPPNSLEPCDDLGHGTHTMGTILGYDPTIDTNIGMAPGARWIGCRNMNQGVGSPATYIECYQWFLAPTDLSSENPRPDLAPDIINNSWSCPLDEGCTEPDILKEVVDNVRAAGILTVQSAGNAGHGDNLCSTIQDPGGIYDSSFTVGATDSNDELAIFSSVGPVTVDGSLRLKPDITAPGVSIYSSLLNGGYGTLSGTSMAAPHVVGLAALLLSINPELRGQVDALEEFIRQSAHHMTTDLGCGDTAGVIPNNAYGWGRIDAVAAMKLVAPHALQISNTVSASIAFPGEPLTYTLQVTHVHPISPTLNVLISDQVPAGSLFLSATEPYTLSGDTVTWEIPELGANASASVELVVQVQEDALGPLINENYSARSAETGEVRGKSVQTPILGKYHLVLPLVAANDYVNIDVPFPFGKR